MSLDITDNNHWMMLVDILVQSIFFYDIYCEIELCGFVANWTTKNYVFILLRLINYKYHAK